MFILINLQALNPGATAQDALDHQTVTCVAFIVVLDNFAQVVIFYVMDAADIQRSMGPRALRNPANNITDPGPALHQQYITGLQFKADAFVVA